MLSLSLGPSLTQAQELTLEQKQLLKQKLENQQKQALTLRIELVQLIRLNKYNPDSTCPNCHYKLTTEEILKGFNDDPIDFSTKCPKCNRRFPAEMVCDIGSTTIRLPFLCPMQTLYQLIDKENLSPLELAKQFPSVYRSAIIHYKGIKAAFAKRNIDYKFEEIDKWQNIVIPYLGLLQDAIIADCVDVQPRQVSLLRNKLGIKKYCLKNLLMNKLED